MFICIEYFKDFVFPLLTTIIAGGGVIATIILGFAAVKTYRSNEKQKQFEFFYGIFNEKYLENPEMQKLRSLFISEANVSNNREEWTEDDKIAIKELEEYPPVHKYYLLAIFEQVGIALNSGLINLAVAHHMFGYFSIATNKSNHFWANLPGEREDDYWKVYFDFVAKMQEAEKRDLKAADIKFE